jgi:hypothetical protein
MISCPFCGARSHLDIEVPVTETRSWTHHCPVCKKPWKVKVWVRRGRTELNVEPDVEGATMAKPPARKAPKKKTKAKRTPAKPKKKTKKR